MTAAMVIGEKKGAAVAPHIKAWLTDVGHQSLWGGLGGLGSRLYMHLPWYACASEREISAMHLYSEGRSVRL